MIMKWAHCLCWVAMAAHGGKRREEKEVRRKKRNRGEARRSTEERVALSSFVLGWTTAGSREKRGRGTERGEREAERGKRRMGGAGVGKEDESLRVSTRLYLAAKNVPSIDAQHEEHKYLFNTANKKPVSQGHGEDTRERLGGDRED